MRKEETFTGHVDSSTRLFIHWPFLTEKNEETEDSMGNISNKKI
jgi:hypothetical protein